MKKRLSLLVAISAMALGLGAAVGVGANQKAESAKASVITYYLTGSFNGFSTDLSKCYPFEYHNENEVKILGHAFTSWNTFKAIYAEDGVFKGWAGDIYGVGDGDNAINSRTGIHVYADHTNAGIHYNEDSSTNYFNIYFNRTNAHFYIDYAYKLTVGTTDYWMERGSGEQYQKTAVSAVAGNNISVTSFTGAAETVNPETKASNNVTTISKEIKVGGTHNFYWGSTDKTAWVSGYAPSSTKLQDFCDNILAKSCDATDLSDCGWSNLSPEEKAEFNKESNIIPGYDKTYEDYGNVVKEAATRYDLLVSKGATPINGVDLSSNAYFQVVTANETTNPTGIILLVVAGMIVLAGGYFLVRRARKED